jgi:hypothetical protein
VTIRCPGCDTVYRAPPHAALDPNATFRCARCDRVFDADIEAVPPPFPADDEAPDPADRDEAGTEDDMPASPDAAPTRRRPSVARFALRTLVTVAVVFALLSIYLFMHRGGVADLLAQIPVVGPDLAATRLNPADVQLTDVRGEFTRAQGNALVFVITGRAVNNAPVPVSAIEIEGSVVGSREQRRTVLAGTAPRHVQDLSEREIDLLQTLEPPQNWRLLPGEEGDFLLAFVDPPVPLREFAVEVGAVRRRRRSGSD